MKKILIVDDDPKVRESTSLYLETQGFKTFCAQDGQEAITRQREVKADMALVDIFMPNKGGFDTILALQNNIPVIAMSGVSAHRFEPLGFAMSLGAVSTLSKPFKAAELLNAINDVLEPSLSFS